MEIFCKSDLNHLGLFFYSLKYICNYFVHFIYKESVYGKILKRQLNFI